MKNNKLTLGILMFGPKVGPNVDPSDDCSIEMVLWTPNVVGVCDFPMYGVLGLTVIKRLGY